MDTKTKAKQLYNEIWDELYWDVDIHNQNCIDHTKKICLIMINEIIKEHCHESEHKEPNAQDRWVEYWQSVKAELNAL